MQRVGEWNEQGPAQPAQPIPAEDKEASTKKPSREQERHIEDVLEDLESLPELTPDFFERLPPPVVEEDYRLYHYHSEMARGTFRTFPREVKGGRGRDSKAPPSPFCATVTVDSAIRGFIAGSIWGAFFSHRFGGFLDIGSDYRQNVTGLDGREAANRRLHPVYLNAEDNRSWKEEGRTAVRRVGGRILTNGGGLALFFATFGAAACTAEKLRKKKDWVNNFFGGAAAGSLVAFFGYGTRQPSQVVRAMLVTGAVTGAVSGLGRYVGLKNS